MSNTVIKSYADVGGSVAKAGKQIVLLVNKDGSLAFEKNALQSLVDENNSEDISVSLVHVNADGKPKNIDDECELDDGVPHINLTVNAFYDPEFDDICKDALQDELSAEAQDLFRISFQNDHCYTPHRTPDEEFDPSPRQNVSLNVTDAKSNIPSSKKITILENQIIPKGKKLINLRTKDGQIVLKGSDIFKKLAEARNANTTSVISSVKSPIITGTNEKHQSLLVESLIRNPSGAKDVLGDGKKLSSPFQNEFIKNLSKRSTKSNVAIINKDVKSLLTKKLESRKATPVGSLDALHLKHKVVGPRVYGNENSDKTPNVKKTKRSLTIEHRESGDIMTNESGGKVEKGGDGSKTNKTVFKKKNPAHMTALLNDMSSLFSTPDVLRRVSSDAKSPKSHEQMFGGRKIEMEFGEPSKYKSDIRTYSNTSNKGNPQTVLKKDSKPSDMEPATRIYQDISETPMNSSIGDLHTLHENETALPANTSNMLLSPSSNINAPLSPSLDILGGIQAEEDGLSEDFLMHVAQLVESSEKLQEVIDTQVLGKAPDVATKEMPVDQHQAPNIDTTQFDKQTTAPVARKEPIQIVRSNGRVITLPPIEAPATRASKRKSLLNTSLDQSMPITNPPVPNSSSAIPTPIPIPVLPKAGVNKKTVKASDKQQPAVVAQEPEEGENIESDESWNSEDDPDRLWCICKQPHNNRFMICCDMCEDWFHGKCVNITKAMGQEMEEKGVEWRCPTCVKKKNQAKFPFKPASSRKSVDSKSEWGADSEIYSHLAVTSGKTPAAHATSSTNCIVCKKAARPSSIYCSDACILRHAQESLNVTLPNATTSGAKQNVAALKDDDRVIVYERKTGKCLAGPSAPTAGNLKTWLKENPTFEVVRPGTTKYNANIPRSKSQKVQSVLKIGEDKNLTLVQPQKNNNSQNEKKSLPKQLQAWSKEANTPTSTTSKLASSKGNDQKMQSPTEQSPKLHLKLPSSKQVTKTYVKSPSTPKTPNQQKQPSLKSPTTPVPNKKDDSKSRSSADDQIRENVRKTLQELLTGRMAETKDVNFSSEEISTFAINIEHELHNLFRDVGVKYKAKYRSLTFNLKDRKNLSLWQKICDRTITPKQLVRLSAVELASQELAQWRDQEAKHQLELIKKSELDLLACNKTYVLKTHKGEEVIESKSLPTAELDPNVTLEDIVSALNNSKEEESKEQVDNDKVKERRHRDESSLSPSPSRHSRRHSSPHHKHSRHRSRSRSKSSRSKRGHSSDKHKSSSKHESSKDSKSSSRSHHRRSSRDKTRSDKHSESSRKSHSDSHHGNAGHHSRVSKSKDKDGDSVSRSSTKRSRSRDHSARRSRSKDRRRHSSTSKDHEKSSSERKHKGSPHKKEDGDHHSHSQDKLNIEETLIIKAAEESDILLPPVESTDVASPPSPGTIQANPENALSLIEGESDQEPSSTVDATHTSIWSGCVGMVDVAKFNVSMFEISGPCDLLVKDLKTQLEIVGRIPPETVWDYVSKMRKQANKEIILTKLLPADSSEATQHDTFFNYLNSRNRLAVVKSHGGCIKDFYILPLPSNSSLPSVLLPLNGSGLGEIRPNLLVGVIVGQKRKRSSTHASIVPSKMSKLKEKEERSYTPPVGSYTPPRSPKPYPLLTALSSTVKHQIAASLASADDEPYSPGDSDSVSRSPTDLHRKMEELDRKIEERKKQIQSIAGIVPSEVLDEPYSPSRPMSPESSNKTSIPGLSDISLPSNLHEILATIQQKTASSVEPKPVPEAYIPTAINVDVATANTSVYYKEGLTGDIDMRVMNSSFNQMHASGVYPPKTSKLSTLSEAELMSMVPDNEVFPPLPPLPLPLPLPVQDVSIPPPPYKRIRVDSTEPPPPGLEDD